MFSGSVDSELYIKNMQALSNMTMKVQETYRSEFFRTGQKVLKMKKLFSGNVFKNMCTYWKNKQDWKALQKETILFEREKMILSEPNYFSDSRIAVYTCVFGSYDVIQEPICFPNNIDYYIVTDMSVPKDSAWKVVDLEPYKEILAGMSPVEKNRWFKMHPEQVFSQYQYSVYIDGNIVPVTDFTEFVNRIGECGVAMYWHRYNNCVYQEALYNRYVVKKINNEDLDKHVKYLKEMGMPENYGMTTCNVIARDHKNPICIKLMNDWWQEFTSHCRRDQMSFPYVVWKNGISFSDIATLGRDVWESPALLVVNHV